MVVVSSEPDLEVTPPKTAAAGLPAVAASLGMAVKQMGVGRTARNLLRLNQVDGFDCMSCAWPDPDPKHRHTAEFCENGAKAVAWEGDTRRVGPEFFAEHSLADLELRTEYWMGQQGRLTHPMVRREGATHYEEIGWDAAFALVAEHLNGLATPDEALFYTSGRASNESAFVYQLFARAYGTNNLPDWNDGRQGARSCSAVATRSCATGRRRRPPSRSTPRTACCASTAVRNEGGRSVVSVPGSDGTPVTTPFTTGVVGDEFTEVASGLNLGQEVLLPQAQVTASATRGGPPTN